MATPAITTRPDDPAIRRSAAEVLADLQHARAQTLALVAALGEEDLVRAHSPVMSPLVWDLGHIAAYEDLWLAHRLGAMPLLRAELADLYDAFETPRSRRGEIELLGVAEARAYMAAVRERTAETLEREGLGDGVVWEMVVRHELQHSETMRQTMAIAGLLSPGDRARMDRPLDPLGEFEDWLEISAGPLAMGAGEEGFAYDNERPRHTVEVPAFAIARAPVSNGSWMHFSEGGGYERREWWSQEGWAWKEEHDITHHPGVATGHPEAAVCHVSWFEADAFARAHHARLPSEAEWEKAATWTQGPAARTQSAQHSAAQDGALAAIGRVWEWTQSRFAGYPGFVAFPYREYSEVFFGDDYRVLRGGSWATSGRVASTTFRNWDLPERRQLFAGLRLVKATA